MTITCNNRKSYTAAFRRKVIQFAEENTNAEVEKNLNVKKNNIIRWRKNKEIICGIISKMKA